MKHEILHYHLTENHIFKAEAFVKHETTSLNMQWQCFWELQFIWRKVLIYGQWLLCMLAIIRITLQEPSVSHWESGMGNKESGIRN